MPAEIRHKKRVEKHCSSETGETVEVLEKNKWIIISDQNADHLKTREKKEVLCCAMPGREKLG